MDADAFGYAFQAEGPHVTNKSSCPAVMVEIGNVVMSSNPNQRTYTYDLTEASVTGHARMPLHHCAGIRELSHHDNSRLNVAVSEIKNDIIVEKKCFERSGGLHTIEAGQ